jgi:hypothetical protein
VQRSSKDAGMFIGCRVFNGVGMFKVQGYLYRARMFNERKDV